MYEKKSIYVKIVRGILMPCSVKTVRKKSRDKMLSHYVMAPSFSEEWSG